MVSEEVDLGEALGCDVVQRERLVPTCHRHNERIAWSAWLSRGRRQRKVRDAHQRGTIASEERIKDGQVSARRIFAFDDGCFQSHRTVLTMSKLICPPIE